MVMLTLSIDTQAAYWPDWKKVFKGGVVIRAAGILNLKWEEFSALDFARKADLHEVDWDALQDDTPGSLDVTLLYMSLTNVEGIKAKLNDPYVKLGLMSYDLSCGLTETVERQTAETEC